MHTALRYGNGNLHIQSDIWVRIKLIAKKLLQYKSDKRSLREGESNLSIVVLQMRIN